MPTPPTRPDDPLGGLPPDYISETDLRELGIDPDVISVECPRAVEYTGHGGFRCWAATDTASFLGRDAS